MFFLKVGHVVSISFKHLLIYVWNTNDSSLKAFTASKSIKSILYSWKNNNNQIFISTLEIKNRYKYNQNLKLRILKKLRFQKSDIKGIDLKNI